MRKRVRASQVVLVGIFALVSVTVAARRLAANAPPGRYALPGDGTVIDTKTKLIWQQTAGPMKDWDSAMLYCADITPSGPGLPGADWRLPSMKELQTITDVNMVNPAVDPMAFPNTPPSPFWTSSPENNISPASAWYIEFYAGASKYSFLSAVWHVRCVRWSPP